MNASYVGPLRRAWARARRMLFKPFDARTWIVLGFAAFLSEALVTGRGLQASWEEDGGHGPANLSQGVSGLLEGGLIAGIVGLLIAAAIVLAVILLWVNSRGRFVFLDSVVREREAIVEPWKRCARAGNSLFVWMLLFILVCAAAATLMLLPFLATLATMWSDHHFNWGLLGALWMLAAMGIPFAIVVAYTVLFLSDFVIPIMYRDGLGATAAWRRFLGLFRAHPGHFLLYGLFVFCLWVLVGAAVTVVGFSTCCVGFVLVSLPYVSSLVLLPVLVTLRGLGPEFLAQFGPDFSVFATVEPGGGVVPAGAPAAGAGAAPAPPGGGA